jgi:hypothetical protein
MNWRKAYLSLLSIGNFRKSKGIFNAYVCQSEHKILKSLFAHMLFLTLEVVF